MVKSEIITRIASKLVSLSEKEIAYGINQIIRKLSMALENNDRIEIRGFGSFVLHYHPQRNAHNPRTGIQMISTHKYIPHFKPGKKIKQCIDKARINKCQIIYD